MRWHRGLLRYVWLLGGCGRVAFDPLGGDGAITPVDVVIDSCTPGTFGPPTWLSSLSSSSTEFAPALDSTGTVMYFSSNRGGGAGGFDIYRAERVSPADAWGAPINVSELNTSMNELGPAISADGLTMYIARDIAGDRGLMVASRSTPSGPFSAPTLVTELSSTAAEDTPAPTADGLTLLFRSDRTGGKGGNDIYLATRPVPTGPYTQVTNLAEINSTSEDRGAAISFDGRTVVFGTSRGGNHDVYITTRATTAEMFGTPTPVLAVNDATAIDDDPGLSADTLELYFVSDRAGGLGSYDLYVATRTCL